MHPHDRDEPALELRFSSAWTGEADELEPDPASWGAEPEPFAEELEGEFGIPTPCSESSLSTDSWNIGPALAAAAFVPMLLAAEPAIAAPPTAETSAPAIESAPTPPADEAAAVWQALVDRHVILTLHDEATFRGTVLSVTEEGNLVCARESDGMVVLVGVAEVAFVQVIEPVDPKASKPPQPGAGLIVLGSIATAIGGSLTIAALAVGGTCASNNLDYGYVYVCPYITAPLGAVGLANLAAGIPMLAVGLRRRADARAAAQQPTVSAFMAPGRQGVMAGFGMRF